MAIFDQSMFNPQSYAGGMSGWLQQALQSGLLGRAIQPQQPPMQPQTGPTYAQGSQGMMGGVPFPIAPGPDQYAQQQTQLPPNAQPAGPAMPQQQESQLPSLFGGGQGIVGKLQNALAPLNPQAASVSMQRQQLQATYQALRQAGVPQGEAVAASLNPEILKTISANYFDTKPQFGVIGQNQMGVNQYGFIRPNQQTVTPATVGGAPGSSGTPIGAQGGIDPNLTGQAFLDAVAKEPSLGPGKAQMVKAIAEGRQPYPSGFLLKTPFGQWLTTAVGQYEPGLDATLIGQRATFNRQMGSATPGSVGGQKTLMGTSLGHLAEVADSALTLNNSNGFGLAPLAHLTNAIANTLGTEAAANANALNEKVDRFSGEVGKLYSGSAGGGVSEREMTRSRFGASQSPQEIASALEASRDLIKSKLAALENQQDQIFGPSNKNRVDFLGENGRAALEKIDTAIAKLRGQQAPHQAPQAPQVQTAINPKTGQRLMLKGNQWVPMQ